MTLYRVHSLTSGPQSQCIRREVAQTLAQTLADHFGKPFEVRTAKAGKLLNQARPR